MKKVFLTYLLLLGPTLYAQDLYEFSLLGGGGLSTLRYDPTLGTQKNGLDKIFGLGYTYFFSSYFGLGTGLEIGFYNSEYNLKNHKMQYRAKDMDDDEFDFTSTVSKYNEEQNIMMLQIPLMLQFQFKSSFYMMMGAKLAIPISGNISGRADVVNSGYYEEENYEYKTQQFAGFGTFKNKNIDVKEDFKTSVLASVEMGKKWRLDDDIALYIGAYFDYGFRNIYVKRDIEDLPQMVDYDSKYQQNFELNNIMNSQYKKDGVSHIFLDKITPMAIGIKVRIAPIFSENNSEKKESSHLPTDTKLLEEEKLQLEKEQERRNASEKAFAKQQAEYLARAENLLIEARLIYEKMQNEQNNDAMRISAERLQIEEELKRISLEKAGNESNDTIQHEKPELHTMLPEQQGAGIYAVQVAVLLEESRAKSMVASLKQIGYNAYYVGVNNPGKLTGHYYRVRVGYFNGVLEAENFAKTSLVKSGYTNWWVDKTANDTKSL
jgi:hypothetical protein